MIKSFKNKALQRFAENGSTRGLSVQNPKRLARILAAIEAAKRPAEVNLPGFRWHPLGDMRPGFYAVEASGNWRVTFAWEGEDAIEVDLEDYH